jgi:hypothetical protein
VFLKIRGLSVVAEIHRYILDCNLNVAHGDGTSGASSVWSPTMRCFEVVREASDGRREVSTFIFSVSSEVFSLSEISEARRITHLIFRW